ncbi:MAG: hypothetical protein ACLT8E_10610 [Akkermansia sp.]
MVPPLPLRKSAENCWTWRGPSPRILLKAPTGSSKSTGVPHDG